MYPSRRYFRFVLVFFSLAAFLLLHTLIFHYIVFAQSTSTIAGRIADQSDAPVSSAAVTLRQVSSGNEQFQFLSGDDGRFVAHIPPGQYRVTITHASLRSFEEQLELGAGESREISVQLAVEPLSASVVVSAEAQPIATAAASEPVTIITRREIEQRGATELAPLLQTVPGFTLGQNGPEGGVASLFLDGGNSNFTKVLVDGVTANEPGGRIDLSNFTLDDIDKVEVVRGAESALAGSDAMTGTIELLTHRGSTHAPLLIAESEGGSFSTGRGMAQLSGLAGRLDYSAATSYFETQGQGPNDGFLNRTLSGNFGLKIAENNSLRFTIRDNTSDAGEPGQTIFVPPNLDDHDAVHNLEAGLSWDFSTGTHWQHRIFASETDIHQSYQNQLSDYYDNSGDCNFPRSPQAVLSVYCDFPFSDVNQYNRADFEAQSTYTNRHTTVTAGYWYEVENGFPGDLFGLHARRNNQAGFIDALWQPAARVALNAGFRAEDNANFGTRVVPRAGVAYTLRQGHDVWGATRLRASYAQGIKEPLLDESFGTDPCNPGNPNLNPERSRTVNAGIEQTMRHDTIHLSADYFSNQFRDIVSFTSCFPGSACPVAPPPSCPFFGTYFNTDLARARGSNVSLDGRLLRWLSLNVNYTYDDTRVLASPNAFNSAELAGKRLLRRPVNQGSVILNANAGRFNGNLTGLFVGRRTDSDFLFPPLGLTGNPGYARFDFATSYRITKNASAIGRVQNVFNRQYQDVLGYPTLGRAIYVGMRFKLGGDE